MPPNRPRGRVVSGSDVLAIAGIVLAVVGILIAAYYGRKALSAGRQKLSWSFESIPLISGRAGMYRTVIEVSVEGRRAFDPHILRLTLSNVGRLDLDSSRFDQDRPLVFELDQIKYVHVIEAGSPAIAADSRSIRIGPELLRAGESWIVTMMTEGSAGVELTQNHLIDVQVKRSGNSSTSSEWASARASVAAASFSVAAALASFSVAVAVASLLTLFLQ